MGIPTKNRQTNGSTTRGRLRAVLNAIRKDWTALVGIAVLFAIVVMALWPTSRLLHDPFSTSLANRLVPPIFLGGAAEYPIGTDGLGRDMFSRIVLGARYSLLIAIAATLVSGFVGVTLGAIAGYVGGLTDSVLMRLVDVQLAFPVILLVLAVIAAVDDRSLVLLIAVLGLSGWARFARLVRAEALKIRAQEYVESIRALGANHWRVLVRHILPNSLSTIVVFGTFEVARILLLESAISFLGLGIKPPKPSWGSIIADGRSHLYEGWWISLAPGIFICLAVVAFNFLGDALRDALDPRSR